MVTETEARAAKALVALIDAMPVPVYDVSISVWRDLRNGRWGATVNAEWDGAEIDGDTVEVDGVDAHGEGDSPEAALAMARDRLYWVSVGTGGPA